MKRYEQPFQLVLKSDEFESKLLTETLSGIAYFISL